MNSKVSKWLSISTKLVQARTALDAKKSKQFVEELNLRREIVENSKELTSELSVQDVEGVYQIIGANSENAAQGYFGILTLKYEDQKYFATWLIEGEDIQTGFGLLLNNILSIHFVYEHDKVEYAGLVSYEFLSKNILSGCWVEEGSDQVGIELGRKLPLEKTNPLNFFSFN